MSPAAPPTRRRPRRSVSPTSRGHARSGPFPVSSDSWLCSSVYRIVGTGNAHRAPPDAGNAITPASVSLEGLAVLLDEGLQRHRPAAADRLDHVVGAGEDAGLVVGRHLAEVLQDERLLEFAPLPLLRLAVHGPGVDLAWCGRPARRHALGHFLDRDLLVADLPAQHAAQDLCDLRVRVLLRPEQRVDLTAVGGRALEDSHNDAGL